MAAKPPAKEKQKQLPVALSPHLRRELEAASAAAGHSLGEEVRRRLFRSFADETVDPVTRALAEAIIGFAIDVARETGRPWHTHPASHRALKYAITARLARFKPGGEPVFAPGELPANRIVTSSEDPEAMGLTIEAFDYRKDRDALDQAQAKLRKEMFEKYPDLRKDHES